MGALWDQLRDLPLEIDEYDLELLWQDVTSGFTRYTTVIRLHGGGHEGLGEDVGYEEADHRAQHQRGPVLELAGAHTLESFSALLEQLELWPEPTTHPPSVNYRRWGYESAALDLALRQAGASLHELLGRQCAPLRFVVSIRLGDPATAEPVRSLLARDPALRFKLDPTQSWDDALIAELAATGAVDTVDLKGLYRNSRVDNPADPGLYRRVAEGFPDAWIEDPALTPETTAVLEPHAARVTWDGNIHGVGDIEALRWTPRAVNIKPSRFGPLRELLATYEHCAREGIAMYGGGQFELGVGRGQLQYLASIFHPDGPNDLAPGVFNIPGYDGELPTSPLPAPAPSSGLRLA